MNLNPYHGIIFTGQHACMTSFMKNIGAYRVRTICAQEGYNVRVVDHAQIWSVEQIIRICDKLISDETFFISISKTFLTEISALFNIETAFIEVKKKHPKINFIIGGAGQFAPTTTRSPWDFQLVGFSENSFTDVLSYMSGKTTRLKHQLVFKGGLNVVMSNQYPTDFNMETLGTKFLPEDDILPTDALPIEIARGCIFKCDFCSFELNGKKKFDYFRIKDGLVEEFQYNYEQFGVTSYLFVDDTYNDSRQKMALIDSVVEELDFNITFETFIKPELLKSFPEMADQMVEQGLYSCSMGVESFWGESRALIGKTRNYFELEKHIDKLKHNTKGWNVGIHYTMILGAPFEPLHSVWDAHEHCLESDVVDDVVFQAMVISGKQARDKSKIDLNPEKYGYKIIPHEENVDPNDRMAMLARDQNDVLNWTNEHTSFSEATEISHQMIFSNFDRRWLSGIGSGSQAHCANYPNVTDENGLRKISIQEITEYSAGNLSEKVRLDKYFENIMNL